MTGLTPLAPGVSAWLDPEPGPGHPNAGVVVDEDGITVIDTLCVPSQFGPFADAVDALWMQDCAHDDGDALVASLRHCVEQLQGRARAALQRCYGLDDVASTRHAAAAAELGLQPNGLKTLLQRTRQLLKACIERSQR